MIYFFRYSAQLGGMMRTELEVFKELYIYIKKLFKLNKFGRD